LFYARRAGAAYSIDNIRVAHPSVNASVMSLMMDNKEGYFKEEGINVEFLRCAARLPSARRWRGRSIFLPTQEGPWPPIARNVQRSIIATWFSFEAGERYVT